MVRIIVFERNRKKTEDQIYSPLFLGLLGLIICNQIVYTFFLKGGSINLGVSSKIFLDTIFTSITIKK